MFKVGDIVEGRHERYGPVEVTRLGGDYVYVTYPSGGGTWKVHHRDITLVAQKGPGSPQVEPFCPTDKKDAGKPRWELLPLDPVEMVVRVLTFGAAKYSDDGWRKVENAKERYFGALLRHIFAFRRGEWLDPESGLPHIAHALCNLVILYELHKDSHALGNDVRPGESKPEAGGEG
jgi:hypothetical protein